MISAVGLQVELKWRSNFVGWKRVFSPIILEYSQEKSAVTT